MKKRMISYFICSILALSVIGCSSKQINETAEDITTENENTTTVISSSGNILGYENKIFDTSYVHAIDIIISEEDWEDLLENPTDKTKYEVNVKIDGEELTSVSFATKGNSSLANVASSESDRYSFKLNFGKFIENQTYYGLDKLNLQNIYADATYMKDYFSYEIMREVGVNAPLASYTTISINGELMGLYLALEDIDESFLERNYGESYGQLYKPETDSVAIVDKNIEMKEAPQLPEGMEMPQAPEGMDMSQMPQIPEGIDSDRGNRQEFDRGNKNNMDGKFDRAGEVNGADLVYIDDEIDSYSDIFNNNQTTPTKEDQERLIQAIKLLNTTEDLSECMDVDSVIRYFVAHNFLMNYDSYTGSMLHNYGLYEQDGVISIIPWDYNLAFGGFNQEEGATTIVNWAIDTPLSSGTNESRPLWGRIAEDDSYMQLYHNYFSELIENYFLTGEYGEEVNRIYEMIRPYVENDPTAWYSVDEFDLAVDTLKEFCELRVQSIKGQLNGSIPATTQEQLNAQSTLVDASGITISDMGSQMNGNRTENKRN